MNGDELGSLHVQITSRTHAAKHPRRIGPRHRAMLYLLAVMVLATIALSAAFLL
ncbi:MAG: hypothetical protein WBC44_21975 [Planctomycetaceae bacterium]